MPLHGHGIVTDGLGEDDMGRVGRWLAEKRRWLAGIALGVGVFWAILLLPYSLTAVAMASIGLVASLFVTVTWLPFVIKAKLQGDNISGLAIVDYAGVSVLGVVSCGLRLVGAGKGLVVTPPTGLATLLGLCVWSLVTTVLVVRAWAWFLTLRRHPRPEHAARVLSERIDPRTD